MSLLKNFAHLQIPLEDVHKATNNFGAENFIRQGGFGKIYKGELYHHGKMIDIVARKLDEKFGQGGKEFWTEIWMLSNLKHQNLVNIIGFCDENNEKIIVNKYEAKGSLDRYLSDPTLMWTQRLQICVDVARALRYIHYDQTREFSVVHRNIKSSKILLNDNWQPKLCGFNLSLRTRNSRRRRLIFAPISGTIGYVDPKYEMSGSATHKSDVYSFGVVLFEVLCGRRSVMKTEGSELLLAYLAKSHYEDGTLDNMIDESLFKQMDPKSYKVFSETAYCCLKGERAQRPHIDQIVIALENALKLQLKRESDEHSVVVAQVEGRESDRWKGKNFDHLKIKLHDIVVATENFAEKYYIGSGGYGKVYKAELEHFENKNQISIQGTNKWELHRKRSTVALKCITKSIDKQGERGFIAEIETLSRCKHRNIVSLLGFCDEGQHMIIVYEFASNGSLEDYLGNTGKMTNFTWVERLNICLDIARGLDYLHTSLGDKLETIHRDMKSANILLNDKWEAMIADFGLSKSYQTNNLTSTINTDYIAGTPFYVDPYYEKTGRLKKASDIYSFGVILFEILCGRLAHDPIYKKEDANGLAPIARRHFEEKRTYAIVDPKLKEENDDNVFTKGLNKDSLDTFAKIAYQCVTAAQNERPKIEIVIEELNKALYAQKNSKPNLKISLEDVKLATQNFSDDNVIGRGGFGKVYHGEVTQSNGCISIAAKRLDRQGDQGEHEFSTELEILLEYKHQNIIGLVGYCDEMDEKVIVYEYASRGNLHNHIKSADLTWIKRLEICIEVAIVLEFFHEVPGTQDVVIHRDIKSGNILLMDDWRPKVTDFGLSLISSISQETDYVIENPCGTLGYVDPLYMNDGILTKGSDIYSFGVVLLEILSGDLIFRKIDGRFHNVTPVLKCQYEEGRFDEMVFEGIKEQISPNARDTFLKIAYQCLNEMREQQPTAREVVLQLKKALDVQIDFETWEPKLSKDYKEIIERSDSPEIYSAAKKEDLYNIFSNGILLQQGQMVLSFDGHGERNELISATKFIYTNNTPHKWRSLTKSSFHKVAEMLDISNLMIKIETKPQFLSPDVVYGVQLVFKFWGLRSISSKPIYVNLKYKMGDETYHTYFATKRDHEWMMIELYRFLNEKNNVEFTFLIESLSPFYCGDDDAIHVEGIEFRALNKVDHKKVDTVKEVLQVYKPNWISDFVQGTLRTENEKLFSLSDVNGKKYLMLSARAAFNVFSDLKLYKSKPSAESRFQEVTELLPQQEFCINCTIKREWMSHDTEYVCFLVFKLSKESQQVHCPVKVRDLLHRENKEPEIIYFTSQKTWNIHDDVTRVPKEREDGWMEVHVSNFDLNRELEDDHLHVNLKFISYEGTMPGLIVNGLEFRPA